VAFCVGGHAWNCATEAVGNFLHPWGAKSQADKNTDRRTHQFCPFDVQFAAQGRQGMKMSHKEEVTTEVVGNVLHPSRAKSQADKNTDRTTHQFCSFDVQFAAQCTEGHSCMRLDNSACFLLSGSACIRGLSHTGFSFRVHRLHMRTWFDCA
jgi:hypothetical protein